MGKLVGGVGFHVVVHRVRVVGLRRVRANLGIIT